MEKDKYIELFSKYSKILSTMANKYSLEGSDTQVYIYIPKRVEAKWYDNGIVYEYEDLYNFIKSSMTINEEYINIKCDYSEYDDDYDYSSSRKINSYCSIAVVDGYLLCSSYVWNESCKTRKNDCASISDSSNKDLLYMTYVGDNFDLNNPECEITNIIKEEDFENYSDIIKKFYSIVNKNESKQKVLKS